MAERIRFGRRRYRAMTRDSVSGRQSSARVTLRTVLASLAEGAGVDEILADFPTLTAEDVRAVVAFAAASTEEDLPVPSLPLSMRIKLDENLPAKLSPLLGALGTTSILSRKNDFKDATIPRYGRQLRTRSDS